MNIREYKTYVFDCDGVLLDSNEIKSVAFYEIALKYGVNIAEEFVAYHRLNGGISRFEKMKYLFTEILKIEYEEQDYQSALKEYGDIVLKKLTDCNLTEGMKEFITKLPMDSRKIIVSGGMQNELREVFEKRSLDSLFSAIYGSPDNKSEILTKELNVENLTYPAVFFGDSLLDYKVATEFEMDFIFISDYTEFKEWKSFFKDKVVNIYGNLSEIPIHLP